MLSEDSRSTEEHTGPADGKVGIHEVRPPVPERSCIRCMIFDHNHTLLIVLY
jgi:hypothetical protein